MRIPWHKSDYERFDAGGLVIEREGRVVHMASSLNADQHAEMQRMLGNSVEEIKARMNREVEELYRILHRYTPQSVIGALWFRNAPIGPYHYHDSELRQSVLAHVEYVATLYLREPGSGTEFAVLPHVVEDVRSRIEALFQSTVWLWIAQAVADSSMSDTSRDFWFFTLMNSLVVRYPGHFKHMKEMLEGIENEMNQPISRWLGWSISDAMCVGDAIIKLVDNRLNENFMKGREEAERVRSEVWPRGNGIFARVVKHFLPIEKRPWKKKAIFATSSWVQFLMQHANRFTIDEICAASGVSLERTTSLMSSAIIPWGSCKEEWYRYPHPTPPLVTQPVINLKSNELLVPVPTSFPWAIKSLVEHQLKELMEKGNDSAWKAYEKARSAFTEQATVDVLAKAFPHAGAFHSLKYSWTDNGETIDGELDGLLLADDTAILVEVKAGSLSPEARRGAPDRLREQLDELVGRAHEQALKAREFLISADEVEFALEDGSLRVRSGKFNEYVLITVNLDPLDMFTTNLNKLVDMEVLSSDSLPWAVSFLDLVVIADAIEFPAQILHFLKRRQRVNELGFVMAYDELEWFGHYLHEGLYFEHLKEQADSDDGNLIININGFSEELDAHYAHDERYAEEKPAIPRQKMPESMRQMLHELENAQHYGYLHISLAFLDLASDARESFFANAERLIERTRIDQQHHDMTVMLDDTDTGLTFMTDVDRERLQKDLHGYCQMKKYQCKFTNWIGIGKVVGTPNWVDEAIIIKQPWQQDDLMEQAVQDFYQSGSVKRTVD